MLWVWQPMERVTGIEPASSVWKTDALTDVLYPRIGGWWVGRGMAVDDLPTNGRCTVTGAVNPQRGADTWSRTRTAKAQWSFGSTFELCPHIALGAFTLPHPGDYLATRLHHRRCK